MLKKTEEEIAAEIQTDLFEIYDKLNPFEDGDTTVDVKIVNVEVCKAVDEIQTRVEEDFLSKQTCKVDLTPGIRKRRDVSSSKENGVIMTEKKSVVNVSFESTGNSTINCTDETQEYLTNEIQKHSFQGAEVSETVAKFSGEKFALC